MLPVPELQDTLILTATDTPGCKLEISGIAIEGDSEDNLCVMAYNGLRSLVPELPGVSIQLVKGIPAGAGLGGGSSDAAYTLKGLNDLFNLGVPIDDLAKIGAKLGADVPFFLYNRPLIASGIGTVFEEIQIDFPYRIEMVLSGIHSSTIATYKALDYRMFDPRRDLKTILAQPVDTWRDELVNDLEVPVFALYPELTKIKADLYKRGAVYAAMSGSGSAMFGLFPS
ncbi:UNVERIFIED_CONTAM: hypothetical protein GTU68_061578 [Idotea baltica]|nr:hypothetical protein [Idotea baltica]